MVSIVFSCEVAIVLSGPGRWTCQFGGNHDRCRPSGDITHSTWHFVHVIGDISNRSTPKFVFRTLNCTVVGIVTPAVSLRYSGLSDKQSFSADPPQRSSWFHQVGPSRPAQLQCCLDKNSFPTCCRSLQKLNKIIHDAVISSNLVASS